MVSDTALLRIQAFEVSTVSDSIAGRGRRRPLPYSLIRLTQAANAFPREAQLVVELPDQLVVMAAQAVRQDEQARGEDTVVECDMTETVVSRQEITG